MSKLENVNTGQIAIIACLTSISFSLICLYRYFTNETTHPRESLVGAVLGGLTALVVWVIGSRNPEKTVK